MYKSVFRRSVLALAAPLAAAACATAPSEKPAVATKPVAPPPPAYVLDDILGAPAGEVDAFLGPPALVRREGEGEYRRYGLKTCTLIVILYPDQTGAVKARHVDTAALKSDQEKPDLETCLAAG